MNGTEIQKGDVTFIVRIRAIISREELATLKRNIEEQIKAGIVFTDTTTSIAVVDKDGGVAIV